MRNNPNNLNGGVDLYTCNGSRNFGGDWIHSTGMDRFSEFSVRSVQLRRGMNFFITNNEKDQHYGIPIENSKSSNPVVLWGGGYLAVNQSSHTLDLWKSIMERSNRKYYAFGLGVGPFNKGYEKLAYEVLSKLESPIYVRTKKDCELLAKLGLEAELSCDVTLLDPGLRNYLKLASQEKVNNLVWLPPFTEHHSTFPSLDKYLSSVHIGQEFVTSDTSTIFLDYSNRRFNHLVKSDHAYWKYYFPKRIRATSFLDVANNLQAAKNFVSGRLHPSLLALILGTPLNLIPNHHEFELLFELSNFNRLGNESENVFHLILNHTSLQRVVERGNRTFEALLERMKSHV